MPTESKLVNLRKVGGKRIMDIGESWTRPAWRSM
jgi:hypothetical protein